MRASLQILITLLCTVYLIHAVDQTTTYTPPSPDMPLNCADSTLVQNIAINELYNGGGSAGNLEMVEIFFNETTDVSGWRLYFNDNNTHKYVNLGTGKGNVNYPDGSTGSDNTGTYPKGTYIVYQIDGIDPTNGEIFITNTVSDLTGGAAAVIDYFYYYKTSPLNYYSVTGPECSTVLTDTDPNSKDISRLTDGSGDFYQYYPGTDEQITYTTGSSNLDDLPPDSTLHANVSIQANFNQSQAYTNDIVTLTLSITNPVSGSISVTDVNVTNLIPSGLSYLSNDGGTLLDPLLPSNPYGTVVSTTPQFFWRLINGSTILTLPINSTAQIDLYLRVTAPAGTTITDTANLAVKQNNIGTTTANDILNIVEHIGKFDAWDSFRSISDRNISTKIVGKPFALTIASLNETRSALNDFNGTVCTALIDNHGNRISDWQKLFFASELTKSAQFTLNRAVGGDDYAGVALHSQWGVDAPCPLSTETNSTIASDFFSVRPASFSIATPTAVAGVDFNITFGALNFSSSPSSDFNESAGNSFNIAYAEHNASCSIGIFSPALNSEWAFVDGTKVTATRYNEVGIVDMNISDKNIGCDSRYARVDCDDANVSDGTQFTADLLPIGTVQTQLQVIPHHFDLNATLLNSGGGAFTYLSRDLNMSSQFTLNVTAKNAEGNTTRNYDTGCYAKNTALTLLHSSVPDPLTKILYRENLSGTDGNTTKTGPIALAFDKTVFTQGSAPLNLLINFDRNRALALNPFDFNISNAALSDSDGVSGTTAPSGTASYLYGRARAYDIRTDQSLVPNPIELEVYSTVASGYVGGMPQNVLKWYRNLNHSSAAQGSILGGDDYATTTKTGISSTISIDRGTSPQNGLHPITISNPGAITHAIIHLEVPSWLWYSATADYDFGTNTKCSQHPCFDYQFFGTAHIPGVSSGTVQGSDFQILPAQKIIQKGVKVFR